MHGGARTASRLGDGLLWVGAVAGALCLTAFVLASVFGVGIVLFRTGSMSPTIPTGSAALVQSVPASDVRIGDVVEIARAGELPITHRVVALGDTDGMGIRALTLRGDANAIDDPAPYLVSRVHRVLFAVPGLAPVIAAAAHPLVLGPVSVFAAATVCWAIWPRRRREPVRRGPHGRRRATTTARPAALAG